MNEPEVPSSENSADVDSLPAVAYHEASHAVAALSLGRTVVKLSVVRNSIRLGVVNLASGRTGRRQDFFETVAIVLLAGMVGEARYTGEYNPAGAKHDLSVLRRLIDTRVSSAKGAERLERRLLDRTEHHLSLPGHWEAVEAITRELLQHHSLSGRAARHLFDQTMRSLE